MKITLYIGGLSGGGAERVTCNLANHMVERNHEVEILTMADDEPSYPLVNEVKRFVLLRGRERRFFVYNSLLRFFRLVKYLRSATSDVIVVMLPVTTILLLILRRLTKAQVIASERSLPSVYSFGDQKLLKRLAHRADGWVFQTKAQKEWYGAGNIQRSVLIPNAINPAFLQPIFKGKRRKRIVTVGSLTKPKNHELLILSFARIANEFKDYQLIIYGKGYKLNSLQRLVNNLGLSERISFPGYSMNVQEEINDAALFILSSDYEGMPNALLEAMALGLPCISTDCDGGGASSLIEDGINGLITPKGDELALSAAMRRMLTDLEFAEKCGIEAHRICEKLSPEKVYGEWESFIKEIAEKQ